MPLANRASGAAGREGSAAGERAGRGEPPDARPLAQGGLGRAHGQGEAGDERGDKEDPSSRSAAAHCEKEDPLSRSAAAHCGAAAGVPDVGDILRRLRKQRGLTLRRVAELSGLSVSFLSAVERGESDISLGRLARVARLFGHDVGSFLGYSARQAAPHFIGGADRLSVDRGPGVGYHVVRVPGTSFEFISVSFAPRTRFADTITHEGLDVLFVLVGTVVLVYNGAEYPLAADDCVVYSGAYPHTVRNDGDGPAQIVFIVTEPVY